MKKYLLVLLSVLAIVAFATTAFALHEVQTQEYTPGMVKAGKTMIELNGQIRIRGEVNDNLSDFTDTDECPGSLCSDHNSFYNQRVRLGVKATVSPNTFGYVELESGDVADGDNGYTWGGLDTKRGSLDIRQAYISTNLGKFATLKAGHMLLALGNNLFFDHSKFGDDAILLSIPVADGELTLLTIKLLEQQTHENDDIDAYVVAFGTPIDKINLGIDVTHLRWHDKSAFDNGARLTNIGVNAKADLGVAVVKADVEYQFGKFGSVTPSGDDTKTRGYAAMLGAAMPAGPVSARINAAYGSGDKESTDDKNEAYINFLGDEQYYTYIYDYKTITAAGAMHTGISNTWYVNAGVTAMPMTDLTILGDVYFLRAAKKVSDVEDSKAIGTELDAKIEYQLDSNLVYYVEAGYLWAGDLYKNVTGGEDPDNPWSVRQGLLLNF